ncbi:DUF4349 domain-containing protein [Citromicrobium bathyomarinum]|uniref:DUF4349 domain-containing protein n=1 Tax=Citromicrobium bathyomarinum TaxID=72174 RepID=UPI003159FB5E
MRRAFRKPLILCAALPLAAVAACSDASYETEEAAVVDAASDYEGDAMMAEETAEAVADPAAGPDASLPQLGALEVSLPKLAYVYDFAFRMPGEDIGTLQRRHADLCEQQGPTSCQIVGMSKSGEEADEVTGELQLAVATRHARAFGALLEKEAGDIGAEQISAEISAEELSKQIVDTQAQLRARTELRDRLMEVLRTRKGSVSELVQAERSVAQVNQEIDQARSWLSEMQGRVAFSKVTVRYETGQPVTSDFLKPVQRALGSLGGIFGWTLAVLIVLGAIALPVGAVVWAARKLGWVGSPAT